MQEGAIIGGHVPDPRAYVDGIVDPARYARVFVEVAPFPVTGFPSTCIPFCHQLSGYVSHQPAGPEDMSTDGYVILGVPPGPVRVAVPDESEPNGYRIQLIDARAGWYNRVDLDP